MTGLLLLAAAVFVYLLIIRYRRWRLTGEALRADRQPLSEFAGRYPRVPPRSAGFRSGRRRP